ncbi:hypothetical protein, partial [Roseovarius sp. SYSU LYC5161]|uniref:hypothetical protein n=1 Tax=Roseovarius halophilus (ex Wu et al. 2025) TaxID=3376060 RepID=UPI003999B662
RIIARRELPWQARAPACTGHDCCVAAGAAHGRVIGTDGTAKKNHADSRAQTNLQNAAIFSSIVYKKIARSQCSVASFTDLP